MSKRRILLPPRLRSFKCRHCYHVYQRASQRQRVFDSKAQLVLYLDRLDVLARRYKVRIHAFCLMSNHVHFLFEQRQKGGISLLMQHLQSYHARFVNGLRNTDGYLWRHHFHAKHVATGRQYRNTLLYIEQNPVEAGICDRAHLYAFSSAVAHTQNQPIYTLARHEHQAHVRLYLDRWRQEFGRVNWIERLRNPREVDKTDEYDPQHIEGQPRNPPQRPRLLPPATARAMLSAAPARPSFSSRHP